LRRLLLLWPPRAETGVVKVNGDAGKENGERVVAVEKPQDRKKRIPSP